MMLKAPRALHLYQAYWRRNEIIVSSWNCVSPGSFVGMGGLAQKELDCENELVLEVQVLGDPHFVLVRDIDLELAALSHWWKRTLQTGIRGADAGVREKVSEHLKRYQRAALRVV